MMIMLSLMCFLFRLNAFFLSIMFFFIYLCLLNYFPLGGLVHIMSNLGFSSFSWILSLLTLLLLFLMINISYYQNNIFYILNLLLFFSLLMLFTLKNYMLFFTIFEFSLFPIIFLITGYGYQPERMSAFKYMFFYTFISSIPLLLAIVVLFHEISDFYISEKGVAFNSFSFINNLMMICFMLGFMVKFPLFGFHLWLPKAHVEAPINGSIILAGVLLKLGALGYIVFIKMLKNHIVLQMLFFFSLMGGFIMGIVCLAQTDLKVLIAYSSVCHLSMCISCLTYKSFFSFISSFIMLIAHGFSSPGLFLMAHHMYCRTNSRNLLLNQNMLTYFPVLTLSLFLLIMANMSAPPLLNVMGEIFEFVSLLVFDSLSSIFITFLMFFSGAYSVVLFSSVIQGQKSLSTQNFIFPINQVLLSEMLLSFFPFTFLLLSILELVIIIF